MKAIVAVLLLTIPAFASNPQADADAALALAAAQEAVKEVVVVVPEPVLPTNPNEPAPQGYQWQSINNGPWKLVKVSEVAAPSRPFPLDTMQGTTVRRAGVRSTSSTVLTGTELIRIVASPAGRSGTTDCKA